jgi:hypothetical protein
MLIGIGMSLMAGLKSSASPASLFANGEVGVWYDPSSVANLAWRYNLLEQTEAFNDAYWSKAGVTVSVNSSTAPDGSATADKLVEDTSTGNHRALNYIGVTVTAGAAYVWSVYAKASERTVVRLSNNNVLGATFDLANSAAASSVSSGITAASQSVGSGWFRLTISGNAATSTERLIAAIVVGGNTSYTGDGTSGIFVWGAQLELGSTVTAYQMITDVVTQTIANCPNNTLYQDSAGTTPVTTPAQTVGLMLDKSKGLVLGSELITNGDFATDTIWTKGTGWTISGGVATKTAGTASNLYQPIFATDAAAKNKITVITFDTTVTAGSFTLSSGGYNVSPTVTASGSYSFRITASEPSSDRNFYVLASAAFAGTIDNVSVKELMGNHAVQATLAQRPTYGINPITGTRNLLTYTEQFDNAAWAKTSLTVSGNQVSYVGGLGGVKECAQLVAILGGTANKTLTAYVTVSGSGTFRLKNTHSAVLDNFSANITATSTPQTVTLTVTNGASAGNGLQAISVINSTGDAAFNLTVHQFQLEASATATAYQKVVSQYEVTQAGVQSAGYIAFDGVDDGMVTNTITPAIDKVQVFAGVRKLSDAAEAVLLEMNTTYDTGNGAFALFAPGGISVARDSAFVWASKGTLKSFSGPVAAAFPAPITNVLAGVGDISSDVNILRVNGVQASQSTANQGTGNFLAYPIYIGRRGGTTQPFNGRLYSLIVRFGANLTDGQITSTESWVNSKVGAY